MTIKTEPFLSGKWGWEEGEGDWKDGVDENFLKFSYMINATLDSFVSSLPPSPTNGTAYFLSTDNTLNARVDGEWRKFPIPKGYVVTMKADGAKFEWTGSTFAATTNLADKTKLDGIATGATLNSSDASLRDRATHTGAQVISTVTGLQAALDGKLPLTGGSIAGGLTVSSSIQSPLLLTYNSVPVHFFKDTDTAGSGIRGYTTYYDMDGVVIGDIGFRAGDGKYEIINTGRPVKITSSVLDVVGDITSAGSVTAATAISTGGTVGASGAITSGVSVSAPAVSGSTSTFGGYSGGAAVLTGTSQLAKLGVATSSMGSDVLAVNGSSTFYSHMVVNGNIKPTAVESNTYRNALGTAILTATSTSTTLASGSGTPSFTVDNVGSVAFTNGVSVVGSLSTGSVSSSGTVGASGAVTSGTSVSAPAMSGSTANFGTYSGGAATLTGTSQLSKLGVATSSLGTDVLAVSGTSTFYGHAVVNGNVTATSLIGGGASITGLTKSQVGLSNVDNTSDINKPIGTATQTALNAKVSTSGNESISGLKTFTTGVQTGAINAANGTQAINIDSSGGVTLPFALNGASAFFTGVVNATDYGGGETAANFYGNGFNLTHLNASNVIYGTLPSNIFPSTISTASTTFTGAVQTGTINAGNGTPALAISSSGGVVAQDYLGQKYSREHQWNWTHDGTLYAAVDIIIDSTDGWGELEINLSGDYTNANNAGYIKKVQQAAFSGSSDFRVGSLVSEYNAVGAIAARYHISDLYYSATRGAWVSTITTLYSELSNAVVIKAKLTLQASQTNQALRGLTLSSTYTGTVKTAQPTGMSVPSLQADSVTIGGNATAGNFYTPNTSATSIDTSGGIRASGHITATNITASGVLNTNGAMTSGSVVTGVVSAGAITASSSTLSGTSTSNYSVISNATQSELRCVDSANALNFAKFYYHAPSSSAVMERSTYKVIEASSTQTWIGDQVGAPLLSGNTTITKLYRGGTEVLSANATDVKIGRSTSDLVLASNATETYVKHAGTSVFQATAGVLNLYRDASKPVVISTASSVQYFSPSAPVLTATTTTLNISSGNGASCLNINSSGGGIMKHQAYTVATVPAASSNTDCSIVVTDAATGRGLFLSDGTNWRNVANGTILV